VEAKSFSFLANASKSKLRFEERRKGFVGSLLLSLQCSDWLADTVEAASLSPGKEDFANSFRENGKALTVHKGCNKAGHFLVVVVFVEGGQRGGIWFLEGRESWGWRCIAGELQKIFGVSRNRGEAKGLWCQLWRGFFLKRSFLCGCALLVDRWSEDTARVSSRLVPSGVLARTGKRW
jgi:hypothetical protein